MSPCTKIRNFNYYYIPKKYEIITNRNLNK